MKFRFTIGKKLGTGFGVLILLTLLVFVITQGTLDTSRAINERNIEVNTPSIDKLQELKILVLTSKMLISNWVNIEKEHQDKERLLELTESDYPALAKDLDTLAKAWNDRNQIRLGNIERQMGVLFEHHKTIRGTLTDFDSYQDAFNVFQASAMLEEDGDVAIATDSVLTSLNELMAIQRKYSVDGVKDMEGSFNQLENFVFWFGLLLVIGGILIAFITTRTIVNPVQRLKGLLTTLGRGVIPEEKMKPRSDEIGEMSQALSELVDGFTRTTEFAEQTGAGNFDADYKPLSNEDTLGHTLLRMRDDLHASEQELERKVEERTEEVVRQKEEIETQKKEMEVLYTHVTDSIKYAKRIQQAILPPEWMSKRLLPESFILYKPKDIVSGDFYWIKETNGKALFAALDCTGHGVPGAFMTIVGHNQLNRAVNEIENPNPANILDEVNKGISEALHTDAGGSEVKDGMDAALCSLDVKTGKLEFAGAYNPLYLIRDGEIIQVKGDKFPVGAFLGMQQKFTNHEVQLQKGDTIYIFSDGFPDQFGGPRGKKFMYRRFRDLLLQIQEHSMEMQRKILDKTLEEWRGNLEQVDDILVIGVRI